jgi:hypothetical protein
MHQPTICNCPMTPLTDHRGNHAGHCRSGGLDRGRNGGSRCGQRLGSAIPGARCSATTYATVATVLTTLVATEETADTADLKTDLRDHRFCRARFLRNSLT